MVGLWFTNLIHFMILEKMAMFTFKMVVIMPVGQYRIPKYKQNCAKCFCLQTKVFTHKSIHELRFHSVCLGHSIERDYTHMAYIIVQYSYTLQCYKCSILLTVVNLLLCLIYNVYHRYIYIRINMALPTGGLRM